MPMRPEVFGFGVPELTKDWFLEKGTIFRSGNPPVRLDILNEGSGVAFARCYAVRERAVISGIRVNLIDLHQLRQNKKPQADTKISTISSIFRIDQLGHLFLIVHPFVGDYN